MSYRRSFLSFALSALAVLSLNGCSWGDVECVISKFDPDKCNFYKASDSEEYPLDKDVIILGDSMWDYGNPRGAIPKELIALSGKTYYDLARSGATGEYIRNEEIPRIPGWNADRSLAQETVKTILASGGANDVREPCKLSSESDVNSSASTLTDECIAAIEKASTEVAAIIAELEKIDSLENLIWGGLIYFPSFEYSTALIDAIVDGHSYYSETQETMVEIIGIKTRCENSSICHYTDLRFDADGYYLWTPDGVDPASFDDPGAEAANYLFDDKHVNQTGAVRVADHLWSVMSPSSIYK